MDQGKIETYTLESPKLGARQVEQTYGIYFNNDYRGT
jgi:hypothetical protein